MTQLIQRSTTPLSQRKCDCGSKPGGVSSCPKCGKDYDRKLLQRKANSDRDVGEVPPIVYEVLRSPGQPLDSDTRAFFEPRFGHDFSRVRVHTDHKAAQSAKSVNARAYTVGQHIAFGFGEYLPTSTEGIRLLAHELTHVRQQSGSGYSSRYSLSSDSRNSILEAEAESVSNNLMLGKAANSSLAADSVGIFRFSELTEAQIERIVAKKFPLQIAKTEERIAAKAATRALFRRLFWEQFWKAIVKRFALRGAIAATLSAADGPLPIGELISLGMLIWTAYEIVQIWDELEMVAQKAALDLMTATPIAPVQQQEDLEKEERVATDPLVEQGLRRKRRRLNAYPICWAEQLGPPMLFGMSITDFVRTPGVERDTEDAQQRRLALHFRESMQQSFDASQWHVHHVVPLFLGGLDAAAGNLTLVQKNRHLKGHAVLRYQPQMLHPPPPLMPLSSDLLKHPAGTPYELIGFKSESSEEC